jgi:hypothetical protein
MFRMRAASPSDFVIPAKALHFVIPAKAGIQFLSCHSAKASHLVIPAKAGVHLLLFFRRFAKTDSRPCVVPPAILAAGSLLLLAQEK